MTIITILAVSLFQAFLCNTIVVVSTVVKTPWVFLSYRGSESGSGSRDPVPAEGDGERDREEDL